MREEEGVGNVAAAFAAAAGDGEEVAGGLGGWDPGDGVGRNAVLLEVWRIWYSHHLLP